MQLRYPFAILLTLAGTQAKYAGNHGAQAACHGVAPNTFRCLTDVSYVLCNSGNEIEQFVPAGTHCKQGNSQCTRLDAIVPGVATATNIFLQLLACPQATRRSVPEEEKRYVVDATSFVTKTVTTAAPTTTIWSNPAW